MKICILSNYTKSLVLFRGPLIKRFIDLGHTVFAYAPEDDPVTADALKGMGVEFRQVPFDRTGTNVFQDLLFVLRFWRLMLSEKPDIFISYTIKPVIYGSIVAKLAGIKRCYSIITGLGYVFIGNGMAKRFIRCIVGTLYKMALLLSDTVFFLNMDDLAIFLDRKIIHNTSSYMLLPGEGIDVKYYEETSHRMTQVSVIDGPAIESTKYQERPGESDVIVFLLIARLLKDKGILEYVGAARIVREKYPCSQFWIVGPLDSNPSAISLPEVQQWVNEGIVTYHGETRDVRPYIKDASVYVLPSYREGMPRTVLEAMAMGRPIITTDAPGCRETVVDGNNGFLVPVKDAQALARAMEKFILHPDLIEKMGLRSRAMAEERFDVNKVNDEILGAMGMI